MAQFLPRPKFSKFHGTRPPFEDHRASQRWNPRQNRREGNPSGTPASRPPARTRTATKQNLKEKLIFSRKNIKHKILSFREISLNLHSNMFRLRMLRKSEFRTDRVPFQTNYVGSDYRTDYCSHCWDTHVDTNPERLIQIRILLHRSFRIRILPF